MNEKLHYPEAFTTINVPKTERRLAVRAFNLLETAFDTEQWNPEVHAHVSKLVDTKDAAQAFWEYENDEAHQYDRFVLSVMRNHMVLGIEHRDFTRRNEGYRTSLSIYNGTSHAYFNDIRRTVHPDRGSSEVDAITAFKGRFFETTANLGLYSHIQNAKGTRTQKESRSANFASAA